MYLFHINRLKDKKKNDPCNRYGKSIWKIQLPFMNKNSQQITNRELPQTNDEHL